MNIQMPVLDGFEATHIIRSDPALNRTPVIALTVMDIPGDRDAGLFEQTDFPERIDRGCPLLCAHELEKKSMKSTILIVDDEESTRIALEAILIGDGYRLEMASSGQDALEKAESLKPDLILLDVMMPGMDGFEVCRRMRARPKLAEVPIIILSALDERFFLLRGLEAGADDFLIKPVDRQELIARAATITRLNRYRTLLEQRESLRQMAGRVVAAQEEERKKISRELHDEMGQALTAHKLNLYNLQQALPPSLFDISQKVDALITETSDLLKQVGSLARDLRPPMLDAFGLQLAVANYCREFSARIHLPLELDIDPTFPPVSDLYATILYRVLQETLTNIAKHANATQVWVELTVEEDRISLTVQDNGQGFVPQPPKTSGLGLVGIRERLELVGGNLTIRSHPGQGSVLSAYLPLKAMLLDEKEVV
jgi:signal transduction histidine kinase